MPCVGYSSSRRVPRRLTRANCGGLLWRYHCDWGEGAREKVRCLVFELLSRHVLRPARACAHFISTRARVTSPRVAHPLSDCGGGCRGCGRGLTRLWMPCRARCARRARRARCTGACACALGRDHDLLVILDQFRDRRVHEFVEAVHLSRRRAWWPRRASVAARWPAAFGSRGAVAPPCRMRSRAAVLRFASPRACRAGATTTRVPVTRDARHALARGALLREATLCHLVPHKAVGLKEGVNHNP